MAESKLSIINKIFSIGAIKCDLNVEQTDLKKSDAEAEKIRLEGNSYFKEGHLGKAIESYTKSLSFATSDELKGKAFGNRSACFFRLYMRDQCLEDIELARKHGYSTRKLRSRRLEALRGPQVPQDRLTGNIFFDQKPYKQLPDTLCCKYDPHFGRGLYAARDILEGETILEEDAFVFARSPKSCYQMLCEFCWKIDGNLIPCPQCADTVFCDSKCMEAAEWYHKHECGKNKKHSAPSFMFNMFRGFMLNVAELDVAVPQALRSVFYGLQCFGNVDQLWNFFLNIVLKEDAGSSLIPDNLSDPRVKYGFFLTLGISNPIKLDDYEHIRLLEALSYSFYMNKSWLGKFSVEEQCKLQHMFLYNFHILCRNASSIPAGNVCYLIGSLFNHSCARNAMFFGNDSRVIVNATKNIQKGEQIFAKYIDARDCVLPTTVTHEYLKETFGFECRCELKNL